MVQAGASVEEQKRRPLAHGAAIRHEARAVDIEEQSHTVDEDAHLSRERRPE